MQTPIETKFNDQVGGIKEHSLDHSDLFVELVFLIGPMYGWNSRPTKKINPFPAFPLVKCSKYLQEILITSAISSPFRAPPPTNLDPTLQFSERGNGKCVCVSGNADAKNVCMVLIIHRDI